MKKVVLIPLVLFLLSCIVIGQNFDNYKIRSLYLSPGIQIGTNFERQIFWGFQFSVGLIIQGHPPNEYIETLDFICPAVTYGYKKYFNSDVHEKYYDLQITVFPDIHDSPMIGLGIGKINSIDYSSFRIKTYTWFLVPVEFDFELKKGRTNLSLIPVLPIGSY